jgi:hypothetical protein
MREANLFYKLTKEDENASTELLCNLCKWEEYGKVILKALGLEDVPIKFEDIGTQKTILIKNKQPDIIIENDQYKIFIENKVNINYKMLQSQKLNYPNELINSKKKIKLIFLVPKLYKDIESLMEVKKKYDFVFIVFWENLINDLEAYNDIKHSEIIGESIELIKKIVNSVSNIIFTEEDIEFMNNIKDFRGEINHMGKELELFRKVIENIKNEISLKAGNKEPDLCCGDDALGYHFFKECCWIGYTFSWLDCEEQNEKDYFLSFAFAKSIIKNNTFNFDKYPHIVDEEEDGWCYFKFTPDMMTKEDILSSYCIEILKQVV